MRKGSSTERFLAAILASVLLLGTGGCREDRESILTGEWISMMIRKAGIAGAVSDIPYYLNIPESSVYFDDVQAAVEWDILSDDVPIDPDAPLTRELAAYTLMNLAGMNNENDSLRIKDLSASQFPGHVRSAVACGLMKLDRHSRFLPDKAMEKEEAERCLEKIISHINSRRFENVMPEVVWEEGEDAAFEECEAYDEETNTAVFAPGSAIREGELFVAETKEGTKILEAAGVREEEDGIVAEASEDGVFDHIRDLRIQGSLDADFTKAEITDLLSGETVQDAYSYTENTAITLTAVRPLRKTASWAGYNVTYEVTSSGINASAVKERPSGLSVYAAFSLSNLHADFNWDMEEKNLKNAYFRISCLMQESLGARRSADIRRYANPASFTKEHFLASVRSAFKESPDEAELNVPLCRVKLPVPGIPVASLVCTLGLRIRADGRAEISFTHNFSTGMEVRNGNMRPIGGAQNTPKAMLQASASLLGTADLSLNAANIRLSDVELEGGLSGTVTSVVHHYDKDGSHTTAVTDMPADLVSEMSAAADNILVCSDVQADWIAGVNLNSEGTAAAKLGLSGSIPIVSGENSRAFLRSHMENFHFVDRCTRTDRQKQIRREDPPETEQIRLQEYSLILDARESASLKLTHIPEGYTYGDLRFLSDDPSVASAEELTVHAHKEGSTIIHIATKDGKYRIRCTVTVRQEKRHAGKFGWA